MRTHPTSVITTIPTDQATAAAVSPLWLILAGIGIILTLWSVPAKVATAIKRRVRICL